MKDKHNEHAISTHADSEIISQRAEKFEHQKIQGLLELNHSKNKQIERLVKKLELLKNQAPVDAP